MATESQNEPAGMFSMGKLSRESYDSAQQFAEDIAANLTGLPSVTAAQSGARITKETKEISIPQGASFVSAPFDASDCIINLINRSEDNSTLRVTTINDSRINLSAAAPDSNHVVSVTRISVI